MTNGICVHNRASLVGDDHTKIGGLDNGPKAACFDLRSLSSFLEPTHRSEQPARFCRLRLDTKRLERRCEHALCLTTAVHGPERCRNSSDEGNNEGSGGEAHGA